MINESFPLWTSEEYQYPVHGKFIPNMVSYIHEEDGRPRPRLL